jgi:hypothetical protein
VFFATSKALRKLKNVPRPPAVHLRKIRPNSWQVSSAAFKPRYRRCWKTEAEAIRDAERLRRRLAGIGLDPSQMRSVEAALHRLTTVECPGRGKSLEFVVEWFLRNYKENHSLTFQEYGEDYLRRKAMRLEDKSMDELNNYLKNFLAKFGSLKPDEVTIDMLEAYLASHSSRYHRDKALRPFFAWLTGTAKAKIARLLNPPIERNTFDYIERVEYRKKRPIEILKPNEVLAVLKEAQIHGLDILMWYVWGLFTGSRPEAEARPFWSHADHGWKKIELDRGIVAVTEDIEKTGTRSRDVLIQPNLRTWLDWMQAKQVIPRYSRRFIRASFSKAVSGKNTQDILRHTFISFALKRLSESEVCYQAATSPRMIRLHYRRLVTDAEADVFWSITPKTLGL